MSLVNGPTMTPEKLAANRRNHPKGHNHQSSEAQQRNREAHLRHGAYAQSEETALATVGEDPAELQRLRAGLSDEFDPQGSLEQELVEQLARATHLLRRTDRGLEGDVQRLARDASIGRDNRLHARIIQVSSVDVVLRKLLSHLKRDHFIAQPHHFEWLKEACNEPVVKELAEAVYRVMEDMRSPGAAKEEQQRNVLRRIKDIFGLSDDDKPPNPAGEHASPRQQTEGNGAAASDAGTVAPNPIAAIPWWQQRYPHITDQQWETMEDYRQWMENMTTHLIWVCGQERQAVLKQQVAGPTIFERAAEVAPANTLIVRRLMDYHFREVRRITNLLLKIQKARRKSEQHAVRSKTGVRKKRAVLRDATETKELKQPPDTLSEAASA